MTVKKLEKAVKRTGVSQSQSYTRWQVERLIGMADAFLRFQFDDKSLGDLSNSQHKAFFRMLWAIVEKPEIDKAIRKGKR